MKALRFHGVKDLRLDEIDEPICGKHQVKVMNTPFVVFRCFRSLTIARFGRLLLVSAAQVCLYLVDLMFYVTG
jgi:hypothetical protein